MTQPQQPVARLSERVTKLERQRVTYREATVLAVHALDSTFDADVAGAGRLDGIPSPPQFMPAVGDVVQLQLSGATPIYQPARVGEGTIGTTELAGYVTENITIAMDTATGKNKVWFSPNAPTVEVGSAVGDPWFKRATGTGIVTGSWEWDGDSWEPRTYGDAVLSSLTVGKLVGGTGTFDLIVAGRIANANTGQRAEFNPLGIQGFNAAGALTIHLDGVTNLIKGELRTGDPGERYVQIGASGNVGAIEFHTAAGTVSMVRSVTSSTGSEAVQMTVPVTGAHAGWNAAQVQAGEEMYLNSKLVTVKIGGATSGTDRAFVIHAADSKVNPNTGLHRVFIATPLAIEASYAQTTGSFSVMSRTSADVFNPRVLVDDTTAYFRTPGTSQRVAMVGVPAQAVISPEMQFISGNNFGISTYYQEDSGGVNGRLVVAAINRTAYAPVWASAFTVNSSGIGKTDRRLVPTDEGMGLVRAVKVTEFSRLVPSPDGSGGLVPSARRELGAIAEELPAALRLAGDGEHGPMWDLAPTMGALISAVQNIDARLARLERGVLL